MASKRKDLISSIMNISFIYLLIYFGLDNKYCITLLIFNWMSAVTIMIVVFIIWDKNYDKKDETNFSLWLPSHFSVSLGFIPFSSLIYVTFSFIYSYFSSSKFLFPCLRTHLFSIKMSGRKPVTLNLIYFPAYSVDCISWYNFN